MPPPSAFKPAWWLTSAHTQTIWPAKLRRLPLPQTTTERLPLPDTDFLDLHWLNKDKPAPTIVLLHGLGGSIHSHYIKGIMPVLAKQGWRVCLMHARTAGGVINRLPRNYHAGETEDLRSVLKHLQSQSPQQPFVAVGYSIGGSMLLNYLDKYGKESLLQAAIAVSVPYNLKKCAQVLDSGSARIYQKHILSGLVETSRRKFEQLTGVLDPDRIKQIKGIYEFDEVVTAPLHGFDNADHYYMQCSAQSKLGNIQTRTLLIHAQDDPFMTHHCVPERNRLSEHVTLEVYEHGGHVGFISGSLPLLPAYWLEERIPSYIEEQLNEN